MTNELKDRISKIRSGEVPEGYKKVKTDIIPIEWEYNELGNYIIQYDKKTEVNDQYPVLTSSRKGLMLQSEYFNNHQVTTSENIGYNIIPYGYITFRSRTDDGKFVFNQNKIIDKGIISYFYPVFLFDEQIDTNFMLESLNYSIEKRFYPYIEGTAQQVLSINKLKKLQFPIPPLPEQQKIAEILSTQDKVIDLIQNQIEELKKLKKAYLQKMFPQKGSLFPEIRFKGFTDAWEQRELGEVFTEYSEKNHEELSPLTIIQGKGTILREESNRNLIYDKAGLKNYKLVNEGDFILHLRSFEGGLEMANSRGIVSPAYHIFHGENADSRFYYPFFRSKYFISVLLKPHVYGIRDGKSIDVEGMKLIRIPYPKIEEQQLIGDYFETLDTLITLHQRKLEQEQQKKKALMQLLLTGIVRVKV